MYLHTSVGSEGATKIDSSARDSQSSSQYKEALYRARKLLAIFSVYLLAIHSLDDIVNITICNPCLARTTVLNMRKQARQVRKLSFGAASTVVQFLSRFEGTMALIVAPCFRQHGRSARFHVHDGPLDLLDSP